MTMWPEELRLPIKTEGSKTIYWCKPLPWGSLFSFFFLMIIMEVHSADSWRELFLYNEKIYVSTGENRRKVLSEDDEEIWEYLRRLRLAAEKYKTSMEMIALQCKAMIVENLIHWWARDLLEKCPRKVKTMRTEPVEERTEQEVDVIIVSSD